MRIYLREEPEVVAGMEDEYADAVRSLVYPILDESPVLTLKPVGAFRVDPHYGSWPNFVFLWSYEGGFASYANGRSARTPGQRETAQMSHDPRMIEYVSKAGVWRQRSMERLLVPLDFSPQPAPRPVTTSPGSLLLEHLFSVAPGRGAAFIHSARSSMAAAAAHGLQLELFARSAGCPNEFLALWSVPSWDAWADVQSRRDPAVADGFLSAFDGVAEHVASAVERTLVPMVYSPLGGSEAQGSGATATASR